jgi:hypothetical protein
MRVAAPAEPIDAAHPSSTFLRAYDALARTHGERAEIQYLRILHLAATVPKRFFGSVSKRFRCIGPTDLIKAICRPGRDSAVTAAKTSP